MSNKVQFQLQGVAYSLPVKHLETTYYNGGLREKPILRINQAAGANIIKQYVKKTFPQATVYTSSDSYSMGNSVNIYLTDERGNPMPKEILDDVKSFAEQFVYGSFNGMIDMYEMKEGGRVSDNGAFDIEMGVKYMFVNDRPKHATLPDVYRMLSNMTSEDCTYIFGQVDLETAIGHAMSFGATKRNCEKAIAMMVEDKEAIAA